MKRGGYRGRRARYGFTLTEVMFSLALISIILAILLLTVTRLARMARNTSIASLRRRHWMETAEQLRWQLRNAYLPISARAPQGSLAAGLVGGPEIGLWGEPGGQDGQDTLSFLSSVAKKHRGVCEVGYRLRPQNGGRYDLVYREFPLRSRAGLHSIGGDSPEAPWNVLLNDVESLSFDYSEDGWKWRRDWTTPQIPRRVRVHLEARALPVLDFQVTPALGSGRW